MPLSDTLEKIFNIETEMTIESAAVQLINGGENIGQKTIMPFNASIAAVAFAYELAQNIDDEFSDVIRVLNISRGIQPIIKGQPNPEMITFASSMPNVITQTMSFMPSLKGLSRQQFMAVIKSIREEKIKNDRGDSITAIKNKFNQ